MTASRHIVPPVHRIREPYATILERVQERDRAYFAEHPGVRSNARPYIPGELSPDAIAAAGGQTPSQDAVVIVEQARPDFRIRRIAETSPT